MAADGAVIETAAVPLPLTIPAATPPATPVLTCSVPKETVSASVSDSVPRSTSATDRPDSARVMSSSVLCAPGRVRTGASLIALTVTGTTSVSISAPPAPVLPRSLVVTVSWLAPFTSRSGTKRSPPAAARVVLIADSEASRVTLVEPLALTSPAATPPATVVSTESVAPLWTLTTTRIVAAPASGSAMLMPPTLTGVSSSVVRLAGTVLTGARFWSLTVIAMVSVAVSAPPAPELPRSSAKTVKVSLPLTFRAGR